MVETGNGAATRAEPRKSWRNAFALYADRRILIILFLGFSSGLPLLLTLSTLSYWLATIGVDKTTIGLFALVGLPYTLKFVWAPVIDRVPIPLLSQLLGRRRSWVVATQALLMAAIVLLGMSDPAQDPGLTALCAFILAFCSASQDIVIDAYRIEILDQDEQGAGAAAVQLGYRAGMLMAGAGALYLSVFLDWPAVFQVMAALILPGMLAVLLGPRAPEDGVAEPEAGADTPTRIMAWLEKAVVEPFADFMARRAWVMILVFILLYKLSDAIGGVMANPFYVEMGFSAGEIASVSKLFGTIATLTGVMAGGLTVARFGLLPALLICGVLQGASNLMFAVQAVIGHDVSFLVVTIAIENLSGGMGAAAFVAFLSSLCHVAYTATQYALLSSVMAFGRTVLSAPGGWLADHFDWVTFFVISTIAALPGLLVLLWMMGRGILEKPKKSSG